MSTLVDTSVFPLNRSEQGYLAIDGLTGSVIQPYLLRLSGPVDEALVRQTVRELISAHPRLRGVVEPGLHLYSLRILPDDDIVDELFDVAWRVERLVNPDDALALEHYHNQLLNEVVPVERGLGLRVRFFPHPQRPVLFFCVHHVLADGRSMLMMVADILKRLNGGVIQPRAMEAPSMVPAIAPRKWFNWPAKLWASLQHQRRQTKQGRSLHVVQLPMRDKPQFSSNALCHHQPPVAGDQLRQAAKRFGTTVNTLLMATLADTFLEMAQDDPKAAAVLRMSVDMRRFYPKKEMPRLGNYVASFLVTEQGQGSPCERMASIDAQVKEGLARFTRREMCWGYLLEETFAWFGRTLYAHLARQAVLLRRLTPVSCHATSLGDLDGLNASDARIKLVEFYPASPGIVLMVGTSELGGKLFMALGWQRSQLAREHLDDFLARFDRALLKVVSQAEPLAQSDAA